jgi:hypothetical protein
MNPADACAIEPFLWSVLTMQEARCAIPLKATVNRNKQFNSLIGSTASSSRPLAGRPGGFLT